MTFLAAIRSVFGNYVGFEGRAGRAEYWWWQLFMVLVAVLLGGVTYGLDPLAQPVGLVGLLLFLPSLAVAVRRLHDIDRSGWYILVALLPVIGTLILLWWYLKPGTPGPNRFGPDPRGA
jgi:uncharacterized membrane protein YhaH (DUF805 family)